MPGVWVWLLFVCFAWWHLVVLVAGCCPSPNFRGGAVRFSVSIVALASCTLLIIVGFCSF